MMRPLSIQALSVTLVSTDLLLEGIHFNLIYSPLKHLGYKAIIRGISDIYAMNGEPDQVLISLGISTRFSVEQVEEIYEGIYLACEKYHVDLAGGDINQLPYRADDRRNCCLGRQRRVDDCWKRWSQGNDLICVTGDFGAALWVFSCLRGRENFSEGQGNPT